MCDTCRLSVPKPFAFCRPIYGGTKVSIDAPGYCNNLALQPCKKSLVILNIKLGQHILLAQQAQTVFELPINSYVVLHSYYCGNFQYATLGLMRFLRMDSWQLVGPKGPQGLWASSL